MKYRSDEYSDWGFRVPAPGWHTVVFQDGIGTVKNEEKGTESIMFPTKIDGGEDDGLTVNIFAQKGTDFGEKRICNILGAVGMYEAFEKNFPGDVSAFDDAPLKAVQTRLPGKMAKVKLELDKTGKYTNVVGICSVSADVSRYDKSTKKGKAEKGAQTPSKPAADMSWD